MHTYTNAVLNQCKIKFLLNFIYSYFFIFPHKDKDNIVVEYIRKRIHVTDIL